LWRVSDATSDLNALIALTMILIIWHWRIDLWSVIYWPLAAVVGFDRLDRVRVAFEWCFKMLRSRKNQSEVYNLLQARTGIVRQPSGTIAGEGHNLDSKSPYRPTLLTRSVWLFILALAFSVQSAPAQTTWSMGYDAPYSNGYQDPTTLDWSALTHIGFLGALPNSDGTLTLSDNFVTLVPTVVSTAHAHNVKAMFVLTGLYGPSHFNDAITNHEAIFIANIMSVVNTYGFDGVDIDNEEAFKYTLMTTLLSDLRTNLGKRLLSATIGVSWSGWDNTLASYCDRVSFMTYDEGTTGDPYTWFNSALHNCPTCYVWSWDLSLTRILSKGIPIAKINFGIPFYGYLETPNTGPRQAFGSSPTFTYLVYSQIVAGYDTARATFDSEAQMPWIAVSGNSWLNYDDPQSITEKVNYVKAKGLGGWIIWTLGADHIPSATPAAPLLDAVKQAFRPTPPAALHVVTVN
jgi:chitinase